MMAAVLCLCHGRFVTDCPRLGYRCVRDIAGPTVLDALPAPAEGLCGICGRPYSCGQMVSLMPSRAPGMPYSHAYGC